MTSSRAIADAAFRALSDPTRRAILDHLAAREHAAGELVERFDVSQPAISQHLAVLRAARLVVVRRDGRRQLYRARPEGLTPLRAWLARYERFWSASLDRLGALLDRDLNDGDTTWEPTPPPARLGGAASSTRRSASSATTPTRRRRSGVR
ncbi:MAG: metalloregulator ArsR/SmtB family transcription factor [Sandaracinaceae bacterium]|nr:metalloregulator ArsR/SmtB family transcription factor [Sandaracinaceae bacterium]